MSNNSKLLVPMYMEALVLRSDKTDCVDLSPQLQNYTQSILGDVLQPDTNKATTLEKGIHLHWTLPKALRHSFIEEGKEMKFPFAPNRWMVIRIQTNQGIKDMPSRIWVVESDAGNEIESGKPVPNWVVLEDNKLSFINIGKSTEWSASYSETPTEPTLTAVCGANPFFALFYPGCRNVFGFHDEMSDIGQEDCTITYVVAGWYSDPGMDPLSPLDFTGDPVTDQQKNRKRELEWFQQQWKCSNNHYPASCLLHASIHSIQWNKNIQPGVPDGAVQVFAGNTAIESLSAQITNSASITKQGVEELLNALQYQLLEDDRNQPDLSTIDNEIQKRGFSPHNRGIYWEVVRKETDDGRLKERTESKPQFPIDIALLSELKKLNETQIRVNQISQELSCLRQEYYFLWYKQALKTVNGYADINGFDYVNSRKQLLDAIVKKNIDLEQLEKDAAQSISLLKTYDELSDPNAEFELKEKLEDRFWEANDPVLLFCGPGIGNTEKPNFQTSDKEINCRTINQLFKELDLIVPSTSPIYVTIDATGFSVQNVNLLSGTKIPSDELKALINETLLLDQALSVDIALLAYKAAQLGEGKNETSIVVKEFANKVIELQSNPAGKDKTVQPSEAYSINKWQQAWSPLFMVWEVAYSPSDQEIKELDLIENTGKWKLKDGLFFKCQSLAVNGQNIRFQGISPFSNAVFANLKRVLPDEIVNKYGPMNLIAQSLSGLNKHLLMQKLEIQLPPLIYTPDVDYNFNTDYLIDQDELNRIGPEAYSFGCNPGKIDGSDANLFYPLRSGSIQIMNLSIVDVFGQIKRVIIDQATNNPEIACSASIKGESTFKDIIPLPPRIVQPGRLQFHWLNAKDEIIYQDAGNLDNPIFGWLVPNYLDNSLMIYDGNGGEVAILQITSDITKDKGLNLLKMPFPGANLIPDLSDHPQLKQLLDNLNTGSVASGLMDLALQVNLNVTGTNALQNNTTALLCGQPIALARCSVGLELLGLPAYNQRWDQTGKENTGDIGSVNFPLYVGNFKIEKDGLLGYFTDADPAGFNTTFNAPEFNFSKSESFFKNNMPVKLSLNQGPIKMNLLLDPSAGVHLATGILPTKFVELFLHNSNNLLSSLNTSFMVAPFIAEKADPGIPIPTSINANWKWTHKSDVTTWQKDSDIPEGKNKELASFKKQQVYEGWLKLNNLKTNNKY